jgi:hypothetical protein
VTTLTKVMHRRIKQQKKCGDRIRSDRLLMLTDDDEKKEKTNMKKYYFFAAAFRSVIFQLVPKNGT